MLELLTDYQVWASLLTLTALEIDELLAALS